MIRWTSMKHEGSKIVIDFEIRTPSGAFQHQVAVDADSRQRRFKPGCGSFEVFLQHLWR